MRDKLLEIDVRLLLLRYGRQSIMEMLDRLGEQTTEQVERELDAIKQGRTPARDKLSKPGLLELVSDISRERPEIAEPLHTIAVNFQNRIFLPELRDAKRYLDRMGISVVGLKSRDAAGFALIRALAGMTNEEVVAVAKRENEPRESDYSLLSQAIMRRKSLKSGDQN